MKKLLTLVFFTLLFISCSTKNPSDETTADFKTTLLKEVQSSPQISEFSITADAYFDEQAERIFETITQNKVSQTRKELFSSLTNTERQNFWEFKLYKLIVDNDFNKEQLNHIAKLMQFINSSTFEQKNLRSNDIFGNNWTNQAEKLFTKDQVYLIAYSLTSFDQTNNNRLGGGPTVIIGSGGDYDCTCNQDSRYTCGRINISTGEGGIEYGDCTYNYGVGCEITIAGCGFLGAFNCDGNECDYD